MRWAGWEDWCVMTKEKWIFWSSSRFFALRRGISWEWGEGKSRQGGGREWRWRQKFLSLCPSDNLVYLGHPKLFSTIKILHFSRGPGERCSCEGVIIVQVQAARQQVRKQWKWTDVKNRLGIEVKIRDKWQIGQMTNDKLKINIAFQRSDYLLPIMSSFKLHPTK